MLRHTGRAYPVRRRDGFTLLEMLVVLVIIGLLAGLVGPQLLGRADSAKVTTAQTQIKMLKGALETLRLDVGRFPTDAEGLSLLVNAPTDTRLAAMWQGPYLSDDIPLDPWGSAYQYKLNSRSAFSLYSWGADGKPGGSGLDEDVGILP